MANSKRACFGRHWTSLRDISWEILPRFWTGMGCNSSVGCLQLTRSIVAIGRIRGLGLIYGEFSSGLVGAVSKSTGTTFRRLYLLSRAPKHQGILINPR